MKKETIDFYDRTRLKSYNLNESMRYQLNLLDTLDVVTRKHSENVANITCRLCEYLHLNKPFTEYCTMCAYLHDVGKLFTPPAVLQKPGKLTDEEYEIMKEHTTSGYKMCMKDLKLRPYAAGPYYHHEALDGSGYPQGVTKKDIPFEAQIIRVADEYDAIVSKRQYKSHIGISDTLKILIENAHPQKDKPNPKIKNPKYGKINPRIVKCLLKVVIDDIIYEISNRQIYLDYLTNNLERFKPILKYKEKMDKAKNEKKKNFYLEGIKMFLKNKETIDNYLTIHQELLTAYDKQKKEIDHLYNEIKIIKKLKV